MLRYLAVLLLASLAQSTAAQENYPSRQITLIAPFAAGGSTDLVARVVSEGLRAKLGQPVIVENKPGGTGLVGAREVVKADPDGYTLLLANAGATVIPAAMSNNYPIDLNKDLLPIGLTAEFVGVVMAKKDLPVNSMQEFIAYAKAHPGKLNFGTSGVGSMVHLSAELLMKETGIKMQHLPYKGGSNSMADLLGGTIDALFVSSPVAVGQAENKNLKMLAVTSRYRLQALPNVPTIEESGVPGFDTTAWLGVMGPAGYLVRVGSCTGPRSSGRVNKDQPRVHHDALEFPDGQTVLLTDLSEGQEATVLQLPTQPATAAEMKAQERVAYIG